MDRQKAFNTVWRAFVVNKGLPSIGVNAATYIPFCKYRGDNGAKCAFGHLIPDEKYDPKIEKHDIYHLEVALPGYISDALGEPVAPEDLGFLYELQRCHDGSAIGTSLNEFHQECEAKLRQFAKLFELEIPTV